MKRRMRRAAVLCVLVVAAAVAAQAAERGVIVRDGVMFVSPDKTAAKLGTVDRGRELVLLEKSNEWLHVIEIMPGGVEHTGWMLSRGIIFQSEPHADEIIFGAAADSEAEAAKSGGRRGAAEDAIRLYAWLAENMKTSPLAAEALYRAADDHWQMERAERWSRPSAKRHDVDWAAEIPEEHVREVMKRYPKTKWADLAAYDLIDNKRCADWTVSPQCAEKEAKAYAKYAEERPASPKAAEALYEAAWRQSALMAMMKTAEEPGKAAEAKAKAQALAGQIVSQYPQQGDWAKRAQTLLYFIQQEIPTFGLVQE